MAGDPGTEDPPVNVEHAAQPPRVVLGVCGGIAAYKAVEVCRRLVDAGVHVTPVLTERRHPVRRRRDLLGPGLGTGAAVAVGRVLAHSPHPARSGRRPRRGGAGDGAHASPATPPGLADDLLCATLLATRAPVIVCPAMHTEMWEHASVRDNLATLERRGVEIVPPESGRLAGGDSGEGRLADPGVIVERVLERLGGARHAARPARARGSS